MGFLGRKILNETDWTFSASLLSYLKEKISNIHLWTSKLFSKLKYLHVTLIRNEQQQWFKGYKNKRKKTYHCLSLLVFLRLKGSQLEKIYFLTRHHNPAYSLFLCICTGPVTKRDNVNSSEKKRRASFYGSRSLKKIKTFSACDYMNSIQSKLSAVVLVLFFNQNPVGNLFTGQRPKYFIPSKGTSAKSNDEAKKKTKLAHHISKYQTSKKT